MMPTEEERQNDDDYEEEVPVDKREVLDEIPINAAKIADEITEMILERLYRSFGEAIDLHKNNKQETEDNNNE